MLKRVLLLIFGIIFLGGIFFIACDDNPVKPPDDNNKNEVKIPELITIDPENGVPGDEINLTGKNFGTSRGASNVLFGEVKPSSSDYIIWNDSLVKMKIPEGAVTGYVKVVVVYSDTTVMSEPVYFAITTIVQPPFISRITPDKAYPGDTVTVEGSYFLNNRDTNYVKFHAEKLGNQDYISWTSSKIIFRVPADAAPASGKIQIVVNALASQEKTFTVLQRPIIEPPVIDYIDPSTARPGDTIRIYGLHFSDSRKYHNGYVVIGGVTVNDDASFIDWKDDIIVMKIPQGVQNGKLFVYKDDLKSNEVDFTLGTEAPKDPVITSFSKNQVKANEFLDIYGLYFGNTQGVNSSLYFGAEKLPRSKVISWSDKKITIQIPPETASGDYEIYIVVEDRESNRMNLTVYEQQKKYLVETVLITAGTFMMGTDEDDMWASPKHQVTLTRDFYMSIYEITQEKYQEVATTWPNYLPDDTGPQKPANLTKWYDIVKWCNDASIKDGLQPCYTINGDNVTCDFSKNGYRLPTEAEWEYACRAGTTDDVHFSSGSMEDYAWVKSNSGNKLNEVGQKLPNAWELYDMYGNAAEWCWDWLDDYPDGPVTDPKGPSVFEGNGKILRGGSMFYTTESIKSWSRTDVHPEIQNREIGFRVVRNK